MSLDYVLIAEKHQFTSCVCVNLLAVSAAGFLLKWQDVVKAGGISLFWIHSG